LKKSGSCAAKTFLHGRETCLRGKGYHPAKGEKMEKAKEGVLT